MTSTLDSSSVLNQTQIMPNAELDGALSQDVGIRRGMKESAADRRFYLLVAIVLILAYSWTLRTYWVPAHTGVDQNAYLVGGRMLLEHGSTSYTAPDLFSFVGRMWIEGPDGRFFPKYPIGYSALVAAALGLGGPTYGIELVYLINPVFTAIALLGAFLLFRAVVGSFLALLGLVILAAAPMTMASVNNPYSHPGALCFVTWGVYLLWRWYRFCGVWNATIGGFALGCAVLLRYTEGLMLLPLTLISLYVLQRNHWRLHPAHLLPLLGWIIPIVVLAAFNIHEFSRLTGYDATNESIGFSWINFSNNWEVTLRQLYHNGVTFALPLAVCGLVLAYWSSWRLALVLTTWVIPSALLYTSYYWAPDGAWLGYLRFFFTFFPALILAALMIFHQMLVYVPHKVAIIVTAGTLTACCAAMGVYTIEPDLETEHAYNRMHEAEAQSILYIAPPDSVVFGEERLLHHLQFIGSQRLYLNQIFSRSYLERYVSVDPNAPQMVAPLRAQRLYKATRDLTEPELTARQNDVMRQALKQKHRVFIALPENVLRQFIGRYCDSNEFTVTVRDTVVEFPEAKQERLKSWIGTIQPWAAVPKLTTSSTWQLAEVTLAAK